MKLIVRRAAAREAAKAKRWYNTRDQTEEERLGDAFMAEFERVVDSLTSLPKRFPLVYPPLRRALLNGRSRLRAQAPSDTPFVLAAQLPVVMQTACCCPR